MTILKKVRYFNKNLTHRLSKNVNQYQAKRVGHITDAQQYNDKLDTGDELNTFEEITTYNNFYEFGIGKSDPSNFSNKFKPRPWSISVEGLVTKPGMIDLEDLISNFTIEDRVYRLRCVEAWSMVIPWYGFALKDVISNVLAGVLILIYKPFVKSDYIKVKGHEGLVVSTDLRYTILRDEAGAKLYIPNAMLFVDALRVSSEAPESSESS